MRCVAAGVLNAVHHAAIPHKPAGTALLHDAPAPIPQPVPQLTHLLSTVEGPINTRIDAHATPYTDIYV